MRAPTCPDADWWNDLLDGGCSDGEPSGPRGHLEDCRQCQETLEHLTATDPSWPEVARHLHERPAALSRTMQQLKASADVGAETAGLDTVPGLDVAFLRPSCDPLHLGRIGPYEVLEVIGQGGMGVVLKALDLTLRRVVAIKVLAPPWASHAAARARFEREARANAAVRNDHVVAIHAVDQADGVPYLVMEHVPGGSLQQRLEHDGPLAVEDIVRIGMQTARGLAAAHAQGLIHRDIKPANILLESVVRGPASVVKDKTRAESPSLTTDDGPRTTDYRVKITDFGLARTMDDVSLTQSGVIAGTPLYMAPEQANGAPLDARADLFSLGSVLYALCTGTPPFRAPTTVAVLKRVCEDTPRPIRALNRTIPPWLEDIVARLLAKDPADRFASADEVVQVLAQCQRHLRAPDRIRPPVVPRRRQRRSRAWLLLMPVLLAAAILPVAACVGLGYALLGLVPAANNADDQPNKAAADPAPPPGLQELAADDPGFKDLVIKLDSDNLFARMDATKRLATLKPNAQRAEVAQKLAKLAGAEDAFTRQGALRALGVWGTAKELPTIINGTSHTDVFTRREALKIAGRFRDERVLAPVMRGFRDFHTRNESSAALRDLGAMAEKSVLDLMNDDDIFLRVAAVRVLRDIGTNASVPALTAAVASNNIHIRGPARDALEAIAARAKK